MSFNGASTFCIDVYGQGQDGPLTIDEFTSATLSKDMYYSTLIVNGTLNTANYVIHCLALGGSGVITNAGGDASGTAAGTNSATGTWPAAPNGQDGVVS